MKGFTLLEMLVVILMIGILSAVALPQYQKSVEKARAAEAVIVTKAIQDAMQRYKQEFPGRALPTKQAQIADVKLAGGQWLKDDGTVPATKGDAGCFITKHFMYKISGSDILVKRMNTPNCSERVMPGTAEKYRITLYKIIPNTASSRVKSCPGSMAGSAEYKYICSLFES